MLSMGWPRPEVTCVGSWPEGLPPQRIARTVTGRRLVLATAAFWGASAIAAEPTIATPVAADLVLSHGAFYTVDDAQPWAEAVAISGGRFVYVGSARGARAYLGPRTREIDLAGRFAMPGVVDEHVHPVMGGLKTLYECNFPFSASPQAVSDAVAACVKRSPSGAWIRGGQWDSGFFDRYALDSPREFLDRVSAGHPVVLVDDSEHNGWVNSEAMRAAGIDRTTADPNGGHIVRAKDGSPNGVLLESAFRVLFRKSLPAWSEDQHVAAVREANRLESAFGITAVKDAGAYEEYLAAYDAVDRAGELSLHVAACLRTPSGSRTEPLDYAALEARRDRYRSRHVDTRFVKIFLDGVPTAARTAAMLAPYMPDSVHDAGFNGELLVAAPLLARDLVELDRRGFTVKMHAAGDRAVQVGLDAIAAARRENGPGGGHHELAHAGYIDDADLGRFATLDAVPDFSPVIWYPSPIIESIIHAVGPRGARYWPTRTLLDRGAKVAGGTDWPAAVPDENPWVGIASLVTRRNPNGKSSSALWPEQAVSLADAIRIYTLNSARALRLEDDIGSIAVGKSADLVVLDRNLFKARPDAVAGARPTMTFFEGRLVYEAPHR
jgi:predicted amidohydrolase YtcJ